MSKRMRSSQRRSGGAESQRPLILFVGFTILIVALALFLVGSGVLDGVGATSNFAQVPDLSNGSNQVQVDGPGVLPKVGEVIVDFAAPDPTGQTIRVSDFRGQPVVINFWATWCPPCRMELPDFEAAYQAHQDDGLVILAVNQDESADLVSAFFRDYGLSFTPVLDMGSQISGAYGVRSFPTTVFVNAEGVVTAVHQGLLVAEQFEAYLSETLSGS